MKKYVFLALCALSVAGGGAFAKDNLAILPFTGGQGEEGETIAELFSFERDLTAVFTPVPRTSINAAIRGEQGFQMGGGMTDPDTIAAIGKQVGARYVVAGSIAAVGKQNLLIIAILQIEGLRQIAGDVQTYGSIGEIRGKLPAMARNIAAAIGTDASRLPRLAVPPVRMAGGADSREADTLAQILAAHLVRSGKYAVYPRTKSLEQVQAEYGNQFNGDVADEYLPSIGMGDNPRLALSVTARKLGDDTMFNAAIINLETGAQEAGETADYRGIEDGVRAMEELAWRLTEQNYTAGDAPSFAQAIAAVNRDTSGGLYTITLNGSFTSDSVTFTANAAKTITLKGEGGTRVITNSGNGPLFTVPAGLTLVLDSGVTLDGGKKNARLAWVDGGTLVMRDGSTLRGSAEGGVSVYGGGSFEMSGGTISGNTASYGNGGGVYVYSGSFTMSGGTISGNTARDNGGGVCVGFSNGSFTMSGGTISGNRASDDYGGGVYIAGDSFVKRGGGTIDAANSAKEGRVVYVYGTPRKVRNSAAGPGVNLDSGVAGSAGGWE